MALCLFAPCIRLQITTNVDGANSTKPLLYEGGISRTTLSSKHVKRKRKNERGKFLKK